MQAIYKNFTFCVLGSKQSQKRVKGQKKRNRPVNGSEEKVKSSRRTIFVKAKSTLATLKNIK